MFRFLVYDQMLMFARRTPKKESIHPDPFKFYALEQLHVSAVQLMRLVKIAH